MYSREKGSEQKAKEREPAGASLGVTVTVTRRLSTANTKLRRPATIGRFDLRTVTAATPKRVAVDSMACFLFGPWPPWRVASGRMLDQRRRWTFGARRGYMHVQPAVFFKKKFWLPEQ